MSVLQRIATNSRRQQMATICPAELMRQLSIFPRHHKCIALRWQLRLALQGSARCTQPCSLLVVTQGLCTSTHLQQSSLGKARCGALRPQAGEMRHQGFVVPQLELLRKGSPRYDTIGQ